MTDDLEPSLYSSAAWVIGLGAGAVAVSYLVAPDLGADEVLGRMLLYPPVGLAAGAAAGWRLGPRGFALPAFLLAGLWLLLETRASDDIETTLILGSMAYFLPLFSTVGVLLGGWLSRFKTGGRPAARGSFIYGHAVFALLLSAVCAGLIAGHAASLLSAPSAAAAGPLLERLRIGACLLVLGAAIAWVRPIQRFLSGDGSARASARRRANGLYPFLAAASAFWALPSLVLGGFFEALAGAYYTAYLSILYFEPYLAGQVLPWLYEGGELYTRKPGATLSVRLKLWLMVVNLVVVPMALVIGTLQLHHAALGPDRFLPIGTAIVALCFVVGYCEVLYRGITRPLAELAGAMGTVSGGDLTVKVPVMTGDELGSIQGHFNTMVEGLAERERLRDTFGRYVSVEIAKRLIDEGRINLGGETIEATILFSDIRDFTPMSEGMDASALVEFLNEYFSHVTAPIMEHGGVINKFIGDAVMAVFAPQFGTPDHVDAAVKTALGMRERLAAFNAGRPEPVRFGVGLHTGTLVAGNIGTKQRLEYTLIGDTVNIASRIEGSNKELESTILISSVVHDRLGPALRGGLRLERCDSVRLKGKRDALTLYKLL